MKVKPEIDKSFEDIIILKVLSRFFVNSAKPAGGVPLIEVRVPVEVEAQKLGVITQAGMVRIVVSVIKYAIEL